MVTFKTYTFSNVVQNHTIEVTFREVTEPVEDEIVRIFLKVNGVWVPLFEEVSS